MPTIEGPITECPECGSEVWDNRGKKKNPKGPDFKCRQNSEHAFWLPKQAFPEKASKPAARLPATGFGDQPDSAQQRVASGTRDDDLIALYWDSFDKVLAGLKERKLSDLFNGKDIAAMSATMVILRNKG